MCIFDRGSGCRVESREASMDAGGPLRSQDHRDRAWKCQKAKSRGLVITGRDVRERVP